MPVQNGQGVPFNTLANSQSGSPSKQQLKDPNLVSISFNPGLSDPKYANTPSIPFKQKQVKANKPFSVKATGNELFDQLDAAVLAKANALISAGHGECVYQPASFPQNGNCSTNGTTGFQCSGSLDKVLNTANCSEMAIIGGAITINHALPDTKLFVSSQNNLTINASTQGVFSTRGDLNVSLSSNALMRGIFAGARANNFNMSNTARLEGLLTILNNGSLAMNLNPSAIFDGQLCTTGTAHINRVEGSQMIYHSQQVLGWQNDLPMVTDLMCAAGTHPYTQIIPDGGSPTPSPTSEPTSNPTPEPTPTSSVNPTPSPTDHPTPEPTLTPTPEPTPSSSVNPTPLPTETPTPGPNDIQFDPADPASLGDLYPGIPGNNNTPVPETGQAQFTLNGSPPWPISQGIVAIELAEPVQSNLEAILTKYNAQVQLHDEHSGFYWIAVDMTKVNLADLEANVITLNNRVEPEYYLNNLVFDNLESAKTFALLAELLVDDRVLSANFNAIYHQSSEIEETREAAIPLGAEQSWWLNNQSTNTLYAWAHNMGYSVSQNRPIYVGVMDTGFAGLDLIDDQIFANGQILWDKGFAVSLGHVETPLSWDTEISLRNPFLQGATSTTLKEAEDYPSLCDVHLEGISPTESYHQCFNFTADRPPLGSFLPISRYYNIPESHGTAVASTIAARVNDDSGIAGVAPHVNIIPFKMGNGGLFEERSFVSSLTAIYNKLNANQLKLDVLNLSVSPPTQGFRDTWVNRHSRIGIRDLIQYYIQQITNIHKVTFVFAAGNGSWNANGNWFLSYDQLPNYIISVGALEDHSPLPNVPNDLFRASYLENIPESLGQERSKTHGSNYGDKVHIWAPGDNMISLGIPGLNFSGIALAPVMQDWGGTSAAAPVVSGIVALIKAQNPSLTTQQIKDVLIRTANVKNQADFETVRSFPYILEPRMASPAFATSQCGFFFHCGLPEVQGIFIKSIDAKQALEDINASESNEFVGALRFNSTSQKVELVLDTGTVYALSWSNFSDKDNLEKIYVRDAYGLFIRMSELLESPEQPRVKATGKTVGQTLFFTHLDLVSLAPPGPLPTPSPKRWYLELFNINDEVRVKLPSGREISATYANTSSGQVLRYEITNDIPDTGWAQINWDIYNTTNNTPGAAWGVVIKADNEVIYRDVRGNAIPRTYTDRFGANRNHDNLGQFIATQTLNIRKNLSGDPNGGSYTLTAFNTSDISKVEVNVGGLPLTMNAEDPYSASASLGEWFDMGQLNRINFKVYSALISPPFDYDLSPPYLQPSHPNYKSYTWGFEIKQGDRLIYRNRDGQRENLDITTYLGHTVGSGANFNQPAPSLGAVVHDETINMFIP